MVEKTNNRRSRRRILQMSGSGLVALTGKSAIGGVAAKGSENELEKMGARKDHRADKNEQNEPKFTEDKRIGFAKGGFGNPVTPDTIDTLYSEVFGNHLQRRRVALPRPAKGEDWPDDSGPQANEVMGIMVAAETESPRISADRKPLGLDSPTPDQRRAIEARIHEKVDENVRSHSLGTATNGGV